MKKAKKVSKKEKRNVVYSLGSHDPILSLPTSSDITTYCKLETEQAWVKDRAIQGLSLSQGISLSWTRIFNNNYPFKSKKECIAGSMILSQFLLSTILEKSEKGLIDIKLAYNDEEGNEMCCIIYGIRIINIGWGVSIDDTSMEVQITYVAKKHDPWTSLTKK